MTEINDGIIQLMEKLDMLLKRQDNFSREINQLREEIYRLKSAQLQMQLAENKDRSIVRPVAEKEDEANQESITPVGTQYFERTANKRPSYSPQATFIPPKIKSDIEKFIGENLINKIGIAITVIGVAIGAKYSIEHELISPLTRIILGYLVGLGLLGFGMKLKNEYENYSAVLVSGAMAIMYFITYSAYAFYGLIPQLFAFSLMVVFTAFTVVAAINYNKQVIAHIGLVGAYAVPFLLSEGSGKVEILFSYMAIINIGVLLISIKKYWKPLYYSSFILTWLIFFSWFTSKYQESEHFGLALTFLSVFFLTFYIIFMAYKLRQNEKYGSEDIILILANAFIFYGIGYSILSSHITGEQLLGLFTLCNALIHFCVSALIYRQMLADRNLFFLIAGLVLIFITIAVPVQLDGNWVTLLWAFEAALLFRIGRTNNVPVYENLSYPLMLLAFFSLIHDWLTNYNNYIPEQPETRLMPLLNINFVTSLLFIASFIFIYYLNNNKKYASPQFIQKGINSTITYAIPAILLIALYYTFRMEISTFWNQLYIDSSQVIKVGDKGSADHFWDNDLTMFKTIWILNYSLLFLSVLTFANIKKFRNRHLGIICLVLSTYAIIVFLTLGLYDLSELRESYLNQELAEYYHRSWWNIGIRYLSFAFVGLMLIAVYKCIEQDFLKPAFFNLKIAFDFLLFTTLLWIASSELINWMDILEFSQSYKLGLSILWGVYALLIIALGIRKRKKHLRIGAIALFGVTLLKLFFYDISYLDTIAKTIVFVSLGVLLLIVSFLYNKYKNFISEENEK